jgi:hypothetical protein
MSFQCILQQLPNKTNDKIKIHLIDWEAWISHCQVYNFPTTPSILFLRKTAFFPSDMMTTASFLGDYNSPFLYNSMWTPQLELIQSNEEQLYRSINNNSDRRI